MTRDETTEEEAFINKDGREELLPPTDKGSAAWTYLAGCFLLEGILWGLTLTFGVFQKHYTHHELFRNNKAIPSIGTLSAALCYFGMPVVAPLTRMYPQYNMHLVWLGWTICICSLLLASFATKVWHLMLTQGLLYGIGWAICYTPFTLMLNHWFVKKRGMVYGILFSSSGIASMVLPFGLEASLQHYGFRTTLRLTACVIFLITAPAFFLIKPRVDPWKKRHQKPSPGFLSLMTPTALVLCLAIYLQGLSWFLPRFFLPSYAHDLALSHTQGATLLAVFGLAQTAGQLTLGWVSDKVNIYIPMILSTGVSAIAALLLWGPAKGIIRLVVFSLLYGSFGGGFTVLWARIALHVTRDENDIITLYGMFSVMRGLGNVFAGPLSSALLFDAVDPTRYGLEKYKGVVGFVGTGMILSAACGVNFFFGKGASEPDTMEKAADESPRSDVFLLSDRDE